jgi:hypothetical protein
MGTMQVAGTAARRNATRMRIVAISVVAALAAFGSFALAGGAAAGTRAFPSVGPEVYQPGTWPLGRPYTEWLKTLYRVNLAGTDPAAFHTDDCSVWPQPVHGVFMILNGPPQSATTTSCTIRAGSSVLVLPGGFVNWDLPGNHVAQTWVPKFPILRQGFRDLQVRVDGRSVPDVARFHVENRVPYPLDIASPDIPPDCAPCEAVGFGTPVMIKPLPIGRHTIVLHDQVLRTGDDLITPVLDQNGQPIWDPATLTVQVNVTWRP